MPRHAFTCLLLAALLLSPLPAAEIRIEGSRQIDGPELLESLSGRLTFVLSRAASPSRADDAAFLVEAELRKRGFRGSQVTAEIRTPNLIVLRVREGALSSLGTVTVDGAPEEFREGIIEQFKNVHQPAVKRILRGANRAGSHPYLAQNVDEGLNNGRLLLQSKGYWKAQVTMANERTDPATGATNVTLRAEPGPLFKLASPRVMANGKTDSALEERLSGLTGEVSTTENITLARNRVERTYRGEGFQDVEILMLADHTDGRTQLTFRVTPGRQYTLRSITIDSDGDTNPERLQKRFDDLPGQIYDGDLINERIRQIIGTGAFQGIEIEEYPKENGTIDVTLHALEGKPDGYYVYTGAGSFEGFIVGAGYYHRNIFDNLYQFTSQIEWSGLGLLGEARLNDPFFLNTELSASARAFILTRGFDGYTKHEAGLGADLTWDVTDHYRLRFAVQTSYVLTDSDGIPTKELGPTNYLLQTIGVTQTYDRRDDPTVPKDGFLAQLTTDVGYSSGSNGIGFFRNEGSVSYYKTVSKSGNIALGIRGGMIIPSEDGTGLPIDLRFFNGGASTVRSFPERELGPKASNGDPSGGEAYWAANLEYMHTIAGPVQAVVFYDAGAINPSFADFGGGDVKNAIGAGIRLNLPIGPVRFEYGHALNPADGDPNGAFHFAIGTAF